MFNKLRTTSHMS